MPAGPDDPQPQHSSPGSEHSNARTRNPWWAVPYFGRTPVVDPRSLGVVLVASLGIVFENFDLAIVNVALPRFGPDLDISTESSGFYLGLIRAGGFLAFWMILWGDRLGRRKVFLIALGGMTLATTATAFAQTAVQFTFLQSVSRGFMLTASAMALVIVVEEFPAGQRGGAIGMLTVLGASGYGLCVLLYAYVDSLPFGWRTLYLFGILPALSLPLMRRALNETRHFSALRAARDASGESHDWLAPLRELARNPRHAALIGLAGMLSAAGGLAVFQYLSLHLEVTHQWSTAQISFLIAGGGTIGISGNVIGGRLADRFGRRVIGPIGCFAAPLFAVLFYLGPEATLILAWVLYIFFHSAGELVIRALSAELFPTSYRSTSAGWLVALQTVGWVLGLFLVASLTTKPDELGTSIAVVAAAIGLAGIALAAMPETRTRELDAPETQS